MSLNTALEIIIIRDFSMIFIIFNVMKLLQYSTSIDVFFFDVVNIIPLPQCKIISLFKKNQFKKQKKISIFTFLFKNNTQAKYNKI